jgi:hypothetical protein
MKDDRDGAVKPTRRDLTLPLANIRSDGGEVSGQPLKPLDGNSAIKRFTRENSGAGVSKNSDAPNGADVPRRVRSSGRDKQFTVKLRLDTMAYIYEQANVRSIPIAQVIEEMVESHQAQQVIMKG